MPEFLTLMIELLFSYLVSGVKVQGAPYFKRHFSSLILKEHKHMYKHTKLCRRIKPVNPKENQS